DTIIEARGRCGIAACARPAIQSDPAIQSGLIPLVHLRAGSVSAKVRGGGLQGMISSGSRVHRYLTLALLLAFTMRALVPAGFMPSTERPFTLEICPQGFQIPLADKHADHASHHGHGSGHHPDGVPADDTSELFKHCPFSSAPGA